MSLRVSLGILVPALLGVACESSLGGPAGDTLPPGVWGGENAGMIVTDSAVHVHIGCTVGTISGRIALDASGRFDVQGSYNLYAYPVDRGTSSPARFTGQAGRDALILTVVVQDSVTDSLVVKGPVRLEFGKEPRMGPCPICRPRQRLSTTSRAPAGSSVRVSAPPGQRAQTAVGVAERPRTWTAPF